MLILTRVPLDEAVLKEKGIETFWIERHIGDVPQDMLSKAEILFGSPYDSSSKSIEVFDSLRWVQLTSDGYDYLEPKDFARKGIRISYANEIYGTAIAEDVMTKLLMMTRKSYQIFKQQLEKKWEKIKDLSSLEGKKILILGTGDIGKKTAVRAKAFGMQIVGFNRSGEPAGGFDLVTNDAGELESHLRDCDFLLVAIPLNRDTYHMVDKKMLSKLSKKCIVINVARGKIIDEEALIDALTSRRIQGAALDVFEKEPLDEASVLWDMDNVIITPHNSGLSEGYRERLIELFLYNLERYPDFDKMKHMIF